jgi:4-hydroxy-tetrahydrodipicolinate reductase
MGRLVAEEIVLAGATLSGGTSLEADIPPADSTLFPTIAGLAAASDAVIDFTHASTVRGHAADLAGARSAWILGTTGLSASEQDAVAQAATAIAVVQAANFSPGVNLVLALARQLGATLPPDAYDAEIVEMHHRQKVDAPSGTALALGRAVAAGRGVRFEDVAITNRDGHTGPRPPGGIGLAALRGGQVVGDHTLIFAAGDEQITLTHRAFDRRAFARGAVRAALWTRGKPPGSYTMMGVLGMEPTA